MQIKPSFKLCFWDCLMQIRVGQSRSQVLFECLCLLFRLVSWALFLMGNSCFFLLVNRGRFRLRLYWLVRMTLGCVSLLYERRVTVERVQNISGFHVRGSLSALNLEPPCVRGVFFNKYLFNLVQALINPLNGAVKGFISLGVGPVGRSGSLIALVYGCHWCFGLPGVASLTTFQLKGLTVTRKQVLRGLCLQEGCLLAFIILPVPF